MSRAVARRPALWCVAALSTLAALARPAPAQTYTWTGAPADPNWSVASNWSSVAPGTIPNGPGVVVRLNGSGAAAPVVNGNFTLGRLTFDATIAPNQSVASGSGGLTFDNQGSAGLIEVIPNSNGAGSGAVAAPLTIAGIGAGPGALALTAPQNTNLTLVGPVSGAGSSLAINAGGQTGTVTLTGVNTYGGAGSVTTVSGGVLQATDGVGLPTNTALALNGAVWESADATITRTLGTGAGELQVTGATAGFSAVSGTTVRLRLGGGTGTVTWGTAAFNPGTLYLGRTSAGRVVFENGLDLNGGSRLVRVDSLLGPDDPGATITGVVSNSTGTGSLTKTGTGLLVLTGANTYNGPTTVSGGVLRANDGVGLPSGSNLNLEGGGAFESIGNATLGRTLGIGAGQIQFNGGGLSANGGTLTVQLNGGNGTVAWGAPGFVAGILQFGSSSFDGVVDFRNGLNLGGASRTINASGPTTGRAGIVRMSGVLQNGGVTVSAAPGATVELAAQNAYTGVTAVSGVLRATDGVGLPTVSNLTLQNSGVLEGIGTTTFTRTLGTGAGQVQITFAGGFSASGGVMTVQLNNGTNTLTWADLGDLFRLQFGSRTSDNLTDFRNGLNLGGSARWFAVEDNVSTAADRTRFSGVITNGGVTKISSPGTLELSATNTYTGATTIEGGALRAAHGVGLPAASNLTLAGGVLEGIGATTFNRTLGTGAGQVRFTGNGGFSAGGGVMTVELNGGTGTLTWGGSTGFLTGSNFLLFGSATADNVADFRNNLNLNGQVRTVLTTGNAGYDGPVGRISGAISGGGLTVNSAFQDHPGTLELTGNNTYAGGTTVVAGRLLVNNTSGSGTGTGQVLVGRNGLGAIQSATLGGGGRIAAVGQPVRVAAGGRIEPGYGADTSLRVETTSGGQIFLGDPTAPGTTTWAVRVLSAGAGGVAADSGGSTTGTVPDPTNHTFLDLSGGGSNTITIDPSLVFAIDGTGVAFAHGQRYSYRIGRTGANELVGGPLNVTDQSRFSTAGFQASDFSLTSDAGGVIYLNFTPVPEPGAALAAAAAGLGLAAAGRRWGRRTGRLTA